MFASNLALGPTDFLARILKSQLATELTVFNDYWTNFWEMPGAYVFWHADFFSREFSKVILLLNWLCSMPFELTFEKIQGSCVGTRWRYHVDAGVLQHVAVCCSVLQHPAVCCTVLQCVPMCSNVFQCVPVVSNVFQCVPVCSSVFPCVAVCCSVFPCVSLYSSIGARGRYRVAELLKN